MTPKPVRRIVFDNPPLIAGTAKMITPIRSTITPRFFNNSFMVIDILYIIFFQAIYNSQVLYFFSIYISLFYFSIKVNSLIKKNKVVG